MPRGGAAQARRSTRARRGVKSMGRAWRLVLAGLPTLALLAGATNHFWLVHRDRLSPWLGGGFGMFSTNDVGDFRRVVVTAELRDGQRYPVTLREPLDELVDRARGLPDQRRLAALAQATRKALAAPGSGLDIDRLAALRIEVWRTEIEPRTLRPHQRRLVAERFELPAGDG